MKIYWKLFLSFWLLAFLLVSTALVVGRLAGELEGRPPLAHVRVLQELGRILASGNTAAIDRWASERAQLRPGELHVWFDRDLLVYPEQPARRAERLLSRARAAGRPATMVRDWTGVYHYRVVPRREGGHYEVLLRLPPPWQRQMLDNFGLRFLVALLVSGLLCLALARLLTGRLGRLSEAVRTFAGGNLGARAPALPPGRGDEISQLARDFNDMAARIEALLGSQRSLLADVSHELRSPLARLQLALEIARRDCGDRAAFSQMEKDLGRMEDIIGNLLLLPRLESGEAALQETVEFGGVVQAVVSDLRAEAATAGKDLRWVAPLEAMPLRANASLLRSGVENILRNAIAHTPAGTAVTVDLRLRGTHCELQVRDFGPGVPERDLEQIFEPFYRVDGARSRESGGVGRGLAITRRVARLHGGTVTAANADPGLCVTLVLPLASADVTR